MVSCAVTSTVRLVTAPSVKGMGTEDWPEDTTPPCTVRAAPGWLVTAARVSERTVLATMAVYEVVPALNVGDRGTPVPRLSPSKVARVLAALE